MDTKKLRQKVLDLAIRGRLVPQDPNDEPASVLLDRIRAEKARLVGEGKIKKSELTEKPISEEEIPFDVPEGWVWTRMGNIGGWGAGATPPKNDPDYYGGDILWLRTGELNNSIVYDTEIKITEKAFKDCSLRMNQIGDVLIAMYGATIGKTAIVGKEMTTNQACCGCTPIIVYNFYLLYYLLASQNDFISKGGGGAQNNISRDLLVKYMFPLPPLAEQRRIVRAVDELFEQIDIIERSEKELEEAADKTRSKLLDLAIQGRLVPQDPNEEPASALLERIRREKARLVQQGKLKKKDLEEKPISPDEIPFDLPEGWVWCRFNSLVNFEMGATPERRNDDYWQSGNHPWVSISDMKDFQTIDNTKEKISDLALQKYFGNKCTPKGTLIMSFKLTIGRVSILGMDAVHNEAIISIYPYIDQDNAFRNYLLHFLKLLTSYIQSTNAIKGSTLNSSKLSQMLVPLPPLAEQRRIVSKLEELLHEIDKLNG